MSLTATGFEDCFAALNTLERETVQKIGRKALGVAADAMLPAAVAAAPILKGDFRASHRVDRNPKGKDVRGRRGVQVDVRADDVGAAAIELGTSDTPAFGSLRRTGDEMAPQLNAMITDALAEGVAQLVGKP